MEEIVKVEMTFDDGSIRYLEGEDAKKWNDVVNSAVSFEWTHFQEEGIQKQIKELKWKER